MRLIWTWCCCWAGSDTNIMSKRILNLKPFKRFLQDYEQIPSTGRIPLDDLTLAPKMYSVHRHCNAIYPHIPLLSFLFSLYMDAIVIKRANED